MIIEYQITRAKFEDLLKQRIIAARPCLFDPISFLNEVYYGVNIEVGNTKLRIAEESRTIFLNQNMGADNIGIPMFFPLEVAIKPLQFSQAIILYLSGLDSMRNSNHQQSTVLVVSMTIIFNLTITVNNEGRPSFCTRAQDVLNLDLPDEDFKTLIINKIKNGINICSDFNLSSLSNVNLANSSLPVPVIINGGIAATPNMSIISMRLSTDNPDASAIPGWTSFFAGNFPSLLFNHDWALLLPKQVMILPIEKLMTKQLASASNFSLDIAPSVTWTPIGQIPVLTVTFSGEIIDGCGGVDIDVDVTVVAMVTAPQSNVIRTSVSLSWEQGDWFEEVICVMLNSTFWPLMGAMFLEEGKLNWWEYLGGLVGGPAFVFTATIAYLGSDEGASQLPSIPEWTEVSDTQWYQDQPFPTEFGGFISGMTLSDVIAVESGLVLTGSISVTQPLIPELGVLVTEFGGWTSSKPCQDPWSLSTFAEIGVWAEPMGPTPRLPLKLCWSEVLNDKYGQYRNPAYISWGISILTSTSLIFALDGLKPEFEADPYPLEVLIISNNGTRLITIPPPTPLPQKPQTPEESLEFAADYLKWKLQNCWRATSIWGILHRFNPEWNIDPPWDSIFTQSWWVQAGRLPEGEVITLTDDLGQELISATSGISGTVEVSALLEHAGPNTRLEISRNGTRMDATEYARRSAALPTPTSEPESTLQIKQVLLVQMAEIPLQGEFHQMSIHTEDGLPMVFVATTTGLVIYSLAGGGKSFMKMPVDGIGGILRTGRETQIWGSGGIVSLKMLRSNGWSKTCDESIKVWDAARSGPYTYLLRNGAVQVLNELQCEVGAFDVSEARRLSIVRDRLVVASKDELTIFDLSNQKVPIQRGVWRGGTVFDLGLAHLLNTNRAIYVRKRVNEGCILDLNDTERPTEIATFHQRPWYVDGLRLGRIFLRLDERRKRIRIYRMSKSNCGFDRAPLLSDIWPKDRSPFYNT
jgi:hypothetical protein